MAHIYDRTTTFPDGNEVLVHSTTCPDCLDGQPAPDNEEGDYLVLQNQVVVGQLNAHCADCALIARDKHFPGCTIAVPVSERAKGLCQRGPRFTRK